MNDDLALTTVEPEKRSVMPVQAKPFTLTPAVSIGEVVGNHKAILDLMRNAMTEGITGDFAAIPGTGPKKSLLKPGAEKLGLYFGLGSQIAVKQTDRNDGHREYEVTVTMIHRVSGTIVGSGIGVCSTQEGKYKKKAPADMYNTCAKMAKKRAFIDAILTATASSTMFTQDVEDMNFQAPQEEPRRPVAQSVVEKAKGLPSPSVRFEAAVDAFGKKGISRERILQFLGDDYPHSPDAVTDRHVAKLGKAWKDIDSGEAKAVDVFPVLEDFVPVEVSASWADPEYRDPAFDGGEGLIEPGGKKPLPAYVMALWATARKQVPVVVVGSVEDFVHHFTVKWFKKASTKDLTARESADLTHNMKSGIDEMVQTYLHAQEQTTDAMSKSGDSK